MTKIVGKGAGRPAAAARTNRHAQRTMLPPKPGVVEEARRPIQTGNFVSGEGFRQALAAEAKNLDSALVEKAAEFAEEWTVQSPSSNEDGPDERSHSKAGVFAAKAGELGWDPSVAVRGDAVELTLTRGDETIVQAWRGGVWQYDASVYAYGDRSTKPRNASGAAKLLSRSADDAKAETSKVAANRHFRKAEPKDIVQRLETAQKGLPFDPELATDEEVLTILKGQSLVWYNRISRGQESAIVGRGKDLRMTLNEKGERVINWCCPVTGFRSCLVTAILKVGRGRAEFTKGQSNALGGIQKVLVEA